MSVTREAFDAIQEHLSTMRAQRPSTQFAEQLSAKGASTVKQILNAARRVFERDGHAGLTLRNVAVEAGVTVGNLNYYFSSKRDLLHAMLKETLADYADAHAGHINGGEADPLETLLDIITFYISNGRRAYPFFFQIWGYAGADPDAKALVSRLYLSIGRLMYYLVRAARPDLADSEVRLAVLQIVSLEEGMKLFIGLSDPDTDVMVNIEDDIRALARRIVETQGVDVKNA